MIRLYLTAREYAALLERQGFKCCVEGCNARDGLIAEHSTPNALKAGKPDQLMCTPCHKVKTLRDVKAIAKARRLRGETMSQYARRRNLDQSSKAAGFANPVEILKARATARTALPLREN